MSVPGKKTHINTDIRVELAEKVKKYCKLNEQQFTEFYDEVLTRFFKDKELDNTLIKLEKPHYFNFRELYQNGETEATTEDPIKEVSNFIEVKYIPNNLDIFNKFTRCYCSPFPDNIVQTNHIGILQLFCNRELKDCYGGADVIEKDHIKILYLVFDYRRPGIMPNALLDEKKKIGLFISLLTKKDLDILLLRGYKDKQRKLSYLKLHETFSQREREFRQRERELINNNPINIYKPLMCPISILEPLNHAAPIVKERLYNKNKDLYKVLFNIPQDYDY